MEAGWDLKDGKFCNVKIVKICISAAAGVQNLSKFIEIIHEIIV